MRVVWVGAWVWLLSVPAAAEEPERSPTRQVAVVRPDGVWEWVEALEGEELRPAQVEAIRETEAEQIAEAAVIEDDLTASPPPVDYYLDPTGAIAPDPLFLDRIDPSEFDIPIEVNDLVVKWMTYFTGHGRDAYARWLSRAGRYQPMMLRELDKAGLPRDLVYLSMIESGYNTYAYSHAHAAGLWQFIASTGQEYDLTIDWWLDERRDPERSLGAAIGFLGTLYRDLGDWRLAWAGYNTGGRRVKNAIAKHGTRDFWELARHDAWLPETENYVPKIMAAAIIGKHPERYGFVNIDPQEELVYDVVSVDGAVDLEVLAACAGITVDELKGLNPALRRFATPPQGYDVRVPAGRQMAVIDALAAVPARERFTAPVHTVRRDETLAVIAKRYKTTVDEIVAANGLASPDRIEVGSKLLIPGGTDKGKRVVLADASTGSGVAIGTAAKATDAKAPVTVRVQSPRAATAKAKAEAAKPIEHTVVEGEFLSKIAERYGVTVAALKAVNQLQSSTIQPGQVLKIPAARSAAPKTHTVARGETLSKIARATGVDAAQIQEWNNIENPEHIEVGQVLHLGGYAPGVWSSYTVVMGDNLTTIARKHACTVHDLREWNGLQGSVIHPGQVLKIRAPRK